MEDVLNRQPASQLLERLFPGWVVLQCSGDRGSHRFISGNSTALFGFSEQELRGKSFNNYPGLVHPEDREAYNRLIHKVEEYTKSMSASEMQLYRFVMQYRVRRGNGSYFHLHDEKMFYLNSRGVLESLSLFRDLSTEKPFSRVQLELFKVYELGYRKISTYVPSLNEQVLTSREMEIVDLIREGLSSKEIADRLYISVNTVRNHRSNLFRKTNARNMVDLLNSAAYAAMLN